MQLGQAGAGAVECQAGQQVAPPPAGPWKPPEPRLARASSLASPSSARGGASGREPEAGPGLDTAEPGSLECALARRGPRPAAPGTSAWSVRSGGSSRPRHAPAARTYIRRRAAPRARPSVRAAAARGAGLASSVCARGWAWRRLAA